MGPMGPVATNPNVYSSKYITIPFLTMSPPLSLPVAAKGRVLDVAVAVDKLHVFRQSQQDVSACVRLWQEEPAIYIFTLKKQQNNTINSLVHIPLNVDHTVYPTSRYCLIAWT